MPSDDALDRSIAHLAQQRPTAVNLRWALDEMRAAVRNLPRDRRATAAYARAAAICDADVETNRSIGVHGAKLICDIAARKKPGERVNVLTHCNAGWLACVDRGTALSPIYEAHDAGIALHVWVDETRPRNQGASLTAFELGGHGVPHTIIVDNAGGHLMQQGLVDLCIVGADRVTSNGDAANKIGTYLKGLAAKDNGVPFYVALPYSTIDWTNCRGQGHPHRGAQRRRGAGHEWSHQGRTGGGRGDRRTRQSRPQRRLRRHARAAHHRPDHRARCVSGFARRPAVALSRAGLIPTPVPATVCCKTLRPVNLR